MGSSTKPTDTEEIVRPDATELDSASRRWMDAHDALEAALEVAGDGEEDLDEALFAASVEATRRLVALAAPELVGLGDGGYRPPYCVHFVGDGVPMSAVLGPLDEEPVIYRQRRP